MGDVPYDLTERTRAFALDIIRLYGGLPGGTVAQVLGKQLLRSGTSVGAQYREGRRAKSRADLVNKVEGALQELEETGYWLELLRDAAIMPSDRLAPLLAEVGELTAILVTIAVSVKRSGSK